MSLRSRVLIVLVVVSAAVAAGVDTVTYLSLRSFLLDRVDQQLVAAQGNAYRDPRSSELDVDGLSNALYYEVRDGGGGIAIRSPEGRRGEDTRPVLSASLPSPPEDGDASQGYGGDAAWTITPATGDQPRYRVAAWPARWRGQSGYALVLALPLAEVDTTLQRLLLVELAVTAAALAAGLLLARTLVGVGLRPLDDIATTAGAIAAGDLTSRVGREEPRTEIGRLGAALNAMLGQIEKAFAERTASENRLRRFVADASHELRTPLTSIRAYAELFERGADRRPEDLGRVLRGIETEAVRMGVLVDDLLLLARLDQGRPLHHDPVDLGALAAEAVDAARAIDTTRPLGLAVDGSVEVRGDRLRLRQVVDNLLANVRAHTPPGTLATVSVQAGPETATLAVTDDGPGLPPEARDRVFERFYRADPSRSRDVGGSGLGLAIVAAIAEAHGGRATVAPRPEGGTSFHIELPVYGEVPTLVGVPADGSTSASTAPTTSPPPLLPLDDPRNS